MSTIFIKVANKSHDLPQIRQNTDARTHDRMNEYITKLKWRRREWRGQRNTHAQKSATNYVELWKRKREREHIGQCIIGIDNDSVRYDLLLAGPHFVHVCVRFFLLFSFARLFSFRYFLYCLDVCEWNQMNWMKASNETGCGKWTPNIHKHAHMREKENMNDKKARNNWKVKPFVMEYTIEYSRNGEKKTFNCRTEFRVDCKFCVCLRAQKNHNYFYADYHFVFLTINWSLFSLSLSLRLLLLFFVL